jgi:hypothetical protein
LVDPINAQVREWIARGLAPIRRRLASLFWLARPGRAGRFLRRLAWLRRRVQRVPAE